MLGLRSSGLPSRLGGRFRRERSSPGQAWRATHHADAMPCNWLCAMGNSRPRSSSHSAWKVRSSKFFCLAAAQSVYAADLV